MTAVDEASEGVCEASPEAIRAGLRERKKARTRQALEDAALDLFVRNGFDHTTVEQIVEACEVSPRTFFRYFATKEEALFGDGGQKLAAFRAALEARPASEPPLRSLRFATLTIVERYTGERARLKARNAVISATPSLRAHGAERQDDWNDAAVQLLQRRASDDPTAPTPLEIRLAVAASSAALRAALHTWLDDESTDLRTLVDDAFDQLAAGLPA
jgi:AcrR family transcriptional regulator